MWLVFVLTGTFYLPTKLVGWWNEDDKKVSIWRVASIGNDNMVQTMPNDEKCPDDDRRLYKDH